MAKLETVMKETIARGARKQIRLVATPLRREVARLKRKLGEVEGALRALRRSAAGWERMLESAPPVPQVSAEEARGARLSPRLIRSLRKRLALSQTALARLVGVTSAAVAHWEGGAAAPKGSNRATLIGLRRVGRREVKDLLARATKKTPARPRRARTRRRKATRRRRKR